MDQAQDALARDLAQMAPDAFATRFASLSEADKIEALRLRFRYDREGFARFCFPERVSQPFSPFQKTLLNRAKEPWTQREEKVREVTAAPRGHAKSTLGSFIEVVHDIVYGLERFIVIISSTRDLSFGLVKNLHRAFGFGKKTEEAEDDVDDNETSSLAPVEASELETLRTLYGPFEVSGSQTDFEVSVDRGRTVRVYARSFGQEVRGVNHRNVRPTLVIVDDGEQARKTRSQEQRARTYQYTVEDILKCGDKRTTYLWRGTVLHPDSVLANLLKMPGWKAQKWQAILSWPTNMALWDRAKAIWIDLQRPDREEAAKAFYLSNRAAMDEGVKVLDPHTDPIWACFQAIWSEGLAAFLKEKQNEPRSAASSLFNIDKVKRFRLVPGRDGLVIETRDGRRIPLSECDIFGHLDPALGENAGLPGDTGAGAGDYAAIAVIARDRFGWGYVLEVWMQRARPADQIEAIWALHDKWQFYRFSIEANGFQALIGADFARIREERRAKRQKCDIALEPDISTKNKELRISSLEPALANEFLLFNEALQQLVLSQFEDFPTGSHDDAPDATEACWRMSRGPVAMREVRRR